MLEASGRATQARKEEIGALDDRNNKGRAALLPGIHQRPERGGELPTWTGELSVASTETCIALGCMMDSDGDTEFTLGQRSEVDPGGIPVFEGKLKTPSFGVVLYSAEDKTILK